MTLSMRKYLSHVLMLSIVAAAACTDRTSPTQPRHLVPQPPDKDISDGAHIGADGKLGNGDVFFLPPMVSNPNNATGYGDPFQPGLPVSFRITDQNTSAIIKTFATSVDLTNQFYGANWDTKASTIDLTHTYRINVIIGTKSVAYADVIFGANGASLKNLDSDDFVGLVDGRTLPMKVRIEQGWDCVDKTSCVTQAVPNKIAAGQTVIVSTGGTLPNSAEFSPSSDGTWATNLDGSPITGPIVVTIQDVTSKYPESTGGCGNGLTLQLTQNHCVRITTDPAVRLISRVRVGTCLANPGDDRQLLVKYDTDPNHQEAPRFLEDAPPPAACPPQIGSATIHSSNPLVRFAATVTSGVGRGLNWVLGVKPAYAFDTGVGGFVSSGDGFSLFAPAFPRRMLVSAGDGQQAVIGTQLPNALVVHFTFVHDVGEDATRADINGANLTCQALTSGSGFATTPVGTADGPTLTSSIPATPLGNGLYSCGRPYLSPAQGANQFKVTAPGVPDAILFNIGNDAIQLPGSVTFTALGQSQTFSGQVTDASGDATAPEGAVAPDLVFASMSAANGNVDIVIRFAPGALSNDAVAQVSFDTDQNPATGHPGVNAGGQADAGIIGSDYILNVGPGNGAQAQLFKYAGTVNSFTGAGSFSYTIVGDEIHVTVPLSALGNDDGAINFKVSSQLRLATGGFTGQLDVMSNVGSPPGSTIPPIP